MKEETVARKLTRLNTNIALTAEKQEQDREEARVLGVLYEIAKAFVLRKKSTNRKYLNKALFSIVTCDRRSVEYEVEYEVEDEDSYCYSENYDPIEFTDINSLWNAVSTLTTILEEEGEMIYQEELKRIKEEEEEEEEESKVF